MNEERPPLLGEFGLNRREDLLREEEPPEPVDEELIRQFEDCELKEPMASYVGSLIGQYRPWFDAHRALLRKRTDLKTPSIADDRSASWWSSRRSRMTIGLAIAASLLVMTFWLGGGDGTRFRDGELNVALLNNGRVSGLEAYDAQWRAAAEEALTAGVKPSASYEQLQNSLPRLRASDVGLSTAIRSPYLTVVREQQPELRWAAMQNAPQHRVELFELGKEAPMLVKETPQTSWTIEAPLKRGETYRWQVFYIVGDETYTAPKSDEKPAVFKILRDEALERVTETEKGLSGSHFLLGLLYAREGLLDEAQKSWEKLAEQNPNSEVVAHLLDGLRALRQGDQ